MKLPFLCYLLYPDLFYGIVLLNACFKTSTWEGLSFIFTEVVVRWLGFLPIVDTQGTGLDRELTTHPNPTPLEKPTRDGTRLGRHGLTDSHRLCAGHFRSHMPGNYKRVHHSRCTARVPGTRLYPDGAVMSWLD